jgi:hypothetical protein
MENNINNFGSYESESTIELNTSLAKAQGEFPSIREDSQNPFFKSKYADLDSIMKAIRPSLSKYGLSLTQQTKLDDSTTILVTKLRHSSGQFCESRVRIIPPKSDIQSYASTLTYMRRYSIISLLALSTSEDDDGENAMPQTREIKILKKPDVISEEQYSELEYELSGYPEIAKKLSPSGFKNMPKDKFAAALKWIKEEKAKEDS